MRAQEIMTRDPACCTPEDTAERAATLMRDHDCGAIPVVESNDSRSIVGVVTDRDIAVRAVAEGRGADVRVRDIMSADPDCCSEDDDVGDVERVMSSRKVRRVPIIDRDGQLVGIVAQADLALENSQNVSDEDLHDVVERISEPDRRVRSAQAD